MPTLTEPSEAVRYDVQLKYGHDLPGADTPLANDFEQWLSYLVDAPPWLSQVEQTRNKAAFFEVSEVVATVLEIRQQGAVMHSPCPDWLSLLVRHWQQERAAVITFNYDQLVELAWLVDAADTDKESTDLCPVPVVPIEARSGSRRRVRGHPGLLQGGIAQPPEGLQLLKLHGSLGWWYSGLDGPPNDTIYDWGVAASGWSFERIGPADAASSAMMTAYLQRMMVPPAAVKSPYYGNRTLQALWRLAAEALRTADELVTMGFGLPKSDMVVSSLLCTNFQMTDDCAIVPVDYGPDIVGRIRETFGMKKGDHRLITEYTNLKDEAIPLWVKMFAS